MVTNRAFGTGSKNKARCRFSNRRAADGSARFRLPWVIRDRVEPAASPAVSAIPRERKRGYRIATRHDKLAVHSLAFIELAAMRQIWQRRHAIMASLEKRNIDVWKFRLKANVKWFVDGV